MTCERCGAPDCNGEQLACAALNGNPDARRLYVQVPMVPRTVIVWGILYVVAWFIAGRQWLRRAWRSSWWRAAGVVNRRWRCELCTERGRRHNQRFCRACWDAGLAG